MDLQLRKINFIQEFLRLNNEETIEKLENLLKSEKSKLYSKKIKPYSIDELNAIIDKAEEDAENNHVKSGRQLRNTLFAPPKRVDRKPC